MSWLTRLASLYGTGVPTFLLTGNITDYVDGTPGYYPPQALFSLFASYDILLRWNRATGFSFADDSLREPTMRERFLAVCQLDSVIEQQPALKMVAKEAQQKLALLEHTPSFALQLIYHALSCDTSYVEEPGNHKPYRILVLIEAVESIAPAGQLTEADRTTLVMLSQWGTDPKITARPRLVILTTTSADLVAEPLRSLSSRYKQVSIPYPDFAERRTYIEGAIVRVEPAFTSALGARLSTGLSFTMIEDILYEALLLQQRDPDAVMTTHFFREAKDRLMSSLFGGLLTIIEPERDLSTIGGYTLVKDYFWRRVIDPFRTGESARLPKGVIMMGPSGTGKTELALAVARECGVTFVDFGLGSVMSKFVGETERQLAEAFTLIEHTLAPCIVFIDEIDQMGLSRESSGDSGVSNRMLQQFLKFLGKPDLRGKVVFLAASNRPDRIDAALVRPGRFEDKVPVLTPDAADRAAILALQVKDQFGFEASASSYTEEAEQMKEGYTGAEIAHIVRKARTYGASFDSALLAQALQDILPSTRDIEEMEASALAACDDLTLVPADRREAVRAKRRPEKAGPLPTPGRSRQLRSIEGRTK